MIQHLPTFKPHDNYSPRPRHNVHALIHVVSCSESTDNSSIRPFPPTAAPEGHHESTPRPPHERTRTVKFYTPGYKLPASFCRNRYLNECVCTPVTDSTLLHRAVRLINKCSQAVSKRVQFRQKKMLPDFCVMLV
jgi:hypothetical protein